jgi:hypothetical protein
MFDNLRRSLREMLDSAPLDDRASLSRMRETLVQARVGLGELREGVSHAKLALEAKRRELETVARRRGQAEVIGDEETIRVAKRYEAELVARIDVLARKLAVQEEEVMVAEREISEMTSELRRAIGAPPPPPMTPADPLADPRDEELAALERSRTRAAREASADALLAELKRRMGK